ncbi:MAG: outer membrane lipoprotein carrier protein LolA [Prevotellaceae bacterium]|jgi:outer membrane lipoprotein-sorting protein|nr:outer membrane lipoprotein carrier protein LolA [Prevotellaceae bacterium]
MKKLMIALIAAVAAAAPAESFARQPKSALEKSAEKMQRLKTVAIDFEYQQASGADASALYRRGSLLIMDRMYKLDWGESAIYFNGQLRWTYLKGVNEVTINTPNPLEDGLFYDPAMLFSFDQKDYRHQLHPDRTTAAGKVVVAVDLFPKDKNAAYTLISLQIDKATHLPLAIAYHGKDGSRVTIKVSKVDPAVKPTAADFTFDVAKHPDVEVVDMR